MHHTYEISLLPPGEELLDIYEEIHPLYESEGMMRGGVKQISGSILDNNTATSKEEIGILSVITEQRIIRRAYLNNRMINVEIDTCSLASIVISDDPKLSRIIRIKRKLRAQPLTQSSQRFRECKQRVRVREEPGPGTTEEKARMEEISKEAFRSGPNIVLTSDDPRRGGRFGGSDKCEAKVNPPSASQRHTARDCRKEDS